MKRFIHAAIVTALSIGFFYFASVATNGVTTWSPLFPSDTVCQAARYNLSTMLPDDAKISVCFDSRNPAFVATPIPSVTPLP